MKKIMFNDKYGLTDAVLNGKKTQTRRVINVPDGCEIKVLDMPDGDKVSVLVNPSNGKHGTIGGVPVFGFVKVLEPKYFIGEVVAVAQNYRDVSDFLPQDPIGLDTTSGRDVFSYHKYNRKAGWGNKMFVKAELMPHHIRITNIRVEKLQDISDEDCLAEGVVSLNNKEYPGLCYILTDDKIKRWYYDTPRKAYASLIDKVSGKGTWDSNQYVLVYDFELVD